MYLCKHQPNGGSDIPCRSCNPNTWAKLTPKERAKIEAAGNAVGEPVKGLEEYPAPAEAPKKRSRKKKAE